LAFSPDGKIMATHLRLWDTQTFKKKFYFSAHDATVRAVRFLSRARLITAGEDATFRIWNQESGEQVREIAPDKECTWLDLMAISPNGDQVAWAHGTDRLHLFDVARSQDVFRVREREGDKAITCVLFSPDGRLLATGGRDYRIDLWQSATGKKQHTLVGHSDDITCLAFFSSGQTLVSGSFDKTIRCWDLTVGTELQSIGQHEERISALAVSPDGRLVASGS
jgi:WD40 repeat protein